MQTIDALQFLANNQPLPPTKDISIDTLQYFDEVRKHFKQNPDARCIPLLLYAMGQGDGHGVYQLVEDTLLAHANEPVIIALIHSLQCKTGSTRYWSALFASNFLDQGLVEPLLDVLQRGSIDERIAAVISLEAINPRDLRQKLVAIVDSTFEPEVVKFVAEVLDSL